MDRSIDEFQYKLNIETRSLLDDYKKSGSHKPLKWYQWLPNIYFSGKITKRNVRGLLLYHGLGSGKTRASVAIALNSKRRVVVILPSTAIANYRDTIKFYASKILKLDADKMLELFTFVSINASNMMKQIKNAIGSNTFDSFMIVVDEAHQLFRQIVNGSINGVEFYEMVMRSIDVKILFLTGTPVTKNPFELVPCMNMIAGKRILPEVYDDFKTMFIDGDIPEADDSIVAPVITVGSNDEGVPIVPMEVKAPRLKNKNKIQNRIFGLISYAESDPSSYPTELPMIIRRTPLERTHQFSAYRAAREKELAESKRKGSGKLFKGVTGPKKLPPMTLSQGKAGSSYKKETRSICNVYNDTSPKIDTLVDDLNKSPGKAIIYSQFREHGIDAVIRRLLRSGWEESREQYKEVSKKITIHKKESEEEVIADTLDEDVEEIGGNETSPTKRFVYIHGEISIPERERLQNKFNEPSNLYGKNIKAFIMTSTGAEGLNFTGVRSVFILEPYWNMSRITQVKFRAIRTNSHKELPEDQQTVQTYLYLSTLPIADELPSTDEDIYSMAIMRQIPIDDLLTMLKEVSIECPHVASAIEGKLQCKVCNPNGNKLFSDSVSDDIDAIDPCVGVSEKMLVVDDIVVDGVTYKYSNNNDDAIASIYGVAIYMWNDQYQSYTRVREDTKLFTEIYEQLEGKL